MTNFIFTLLFGIAAMQAASGTPIVAIRTDVPEVIPGPGMPSLESLNTTSAELYALPVPKTTGDERNVLFNARCGPSESAYCPVSGVIACYNYLEKLGKQNCRVPSNGISHFCRSGSSEAVGQSITGNSESSYCADVALGLLWVINHCTRNDRGDVAGFNAANGNGNLIVGGVNVNYA